MTDSTKERIWKLNKRGAEPRRREGVEIRNDATVAPRPRPRRHLRGSEMLGAKNGRTERDVRLGSERQSHPVVANRFLGRSSVFK